MVKAAIALIFRQQQQAKVPNRSAQRVDNQLEMVNEGSEGIIRHMNTIIYESRQVQ
jgi:hypothetical protein